MGAVQKIEQLKRNLERCKKEKIQSETRLSDVMKSLKEEYDCGSLAEAEEELSAIRKEIRELSEDLEKELEGIEI